MNGNGMRLVWSSGLTYTSTQENAELRLALWDGPLPADGVTTQSGPLPLSLYHRSTSQLVSPMVTDLSSLFGIGQHLVLTTMTVTNNNSNTMNNNTINTSNARRLRCCGL